VGFLINVEPSENGIVVLWASLINVEPSENGIVVLWASL
jgi:hypothetical protein